MRARRVPRPRGGRIFVGMTAMVFAEEVRPVYRSARPPVEKPALCTVAPARLPRKTVECTLNAE